MIAGLVFLGKEDLLALTEVPNAITRLCASTSHDFCLRGERKRKRPSLVADCHQSLFYEVVKHVRTFYEPDVISRSPCQSPASLFCCHECIIGLFELFSSGETKRKPCPLIRICKRIHFFLQIFALDH